MTKTYEFRMDEEDSGARLDVQLAAKSGLTRSQIQRLIETGCVTVGGLAVKANYRCREGDTALMSLSEQEQTLEPENLELEILYIDDHVAVVNKPPGMVIYPAAGHTSGTLMNAIAWHSKKLATVGGPLRPGVVHRLDRDTSGVMVVALDDDSYYKLVDQFRQRTIYRKYKALVLGKLKDNWGSLSMPIGRSSTDRKKMAANAPNAKEALTTWTVMERLGPATLIEAKLGTGRTHQIRVHFSTIGHPVLGDVTYGKKTSVEIKHRTIRFNRQMLHAEVLGFVHPSTGRYMEFTTRLPQDMEEKIREMREALL